MCMETVSAGVQDNNTEHYFRSKDKAETSYDVKIHTIAYVKTQKKIYNPL